MRRPGRLLVAALILIAAVSCRARESAVSAPASKPVIQAVKLPDISRLPPVVQKQLQDQYGVLTQKQAGGSSTELGEAYGRMGMLLMAAEYLDEAAAAFSNAEALAPSEMRWPYYLGHIYQMRGDAAKSAAAFARAVRVDGKYSPALVYLGNAYLDQGKPEAADPLYAQALMQQPRLVAALFGRGRAALARRDFRSAIGYFEQALAIDPQANVVHYPLAMAYRGAGQVDRAEAHLAPNNVGELKPPDPVYDDMTVTLESAVAYELRGGRALESGQWNMALDLFRRGVELAPDEPQLRHKLATAMAMKGDRAGAFAMFEETTRRSPSFVKAHYSLGLMYAEAGQLARAEHEWTTALEYDMTYVEARLQLAELLRRTGRPAAALPQYEKVTELDPRLAEASYGKAMTLVQLRRYREARDALAEAMTRHPEHPAFAIALARVLAAAPDEQARDGARALQVLQALPPDAQRTLDWGVAMAMAFAESGRFDEAVQWQRQALSFVSGGAPALVAHLTEVLRRYERRLPCRTPWAAGEPMEMIDRPAA
jgi:tetratricopeptide (TPR) repeat protein